MVEPDRALRLWRLGILLAAVWLIAGLCALYQAIETILFVAKLESISSGGGAHWGNIALLVALVLLIGIAPPVVFAWRTWRRAFPQAPDPDGIAQ